MARVAPDGYDILVWKLDETSGAYRNTGVTSPNDTSTDLTVQNSVDRNGLSIFNTPCPNFPGTSNFPAGSSATRNSARGGNTINPPYPLTVSCWVNQRAYPSGNSVGFVAKAFRDTGITNTWTTPFNAISLFNASGTDWGAALCLSTAPTAQTTFTMTDFPIPLGQWAHIGFTYDGYTIKLYLNGNQMITYSGAVKLPGLSASGTMVYTDGVNGFGPWTIGAVIATGSPNKNEPNAQISDVRVANVARPLSYFQNIWKFGAGALNLVDATQYYKLRAYDLACTEPTPVFWVDTEISLTNAPAFPCGGPYSDPEVIDTWWA